jgi:hypothetical protein
MTHPCRIYPSEAIAKKIQGEKYAKEWDCDKIT